MQKFDIIVIGGGPAGYNSAEYAARNGKHVLLIEKENLGGTCLNAGCIPTKTFLYAAKMYHYADGAGRSYGVETEGAVLKHAVTVEKKNDVVKTLVRGVAGGLRRSKVTVVNGTAEIEKAGEHFLVSTEKESYVGDKVILATGSVPVIPPIEGVEEGLSKGVILTSNEILNITEIPTSLLIVGGGVIGFEMAAYFQEAGAEVTVIEAMDKVLGGNDREVSGLLQKELEKKGVTFHLSARVKKISVHGETVFEKDGKEERVISSRILLCVGRRAFYDVKGLRELGVETERGAVITDEHMRTNVEGLYAIGDVNGKYMLAHVGYREGEAAINHILGIKDSMNYKAVCSVVYTTPEAAFVGISEEEAQRLGRPYGVKKISVNFSGRHMAENGMSNGICKLLIDAEKNVIIGASLMSSYASEYVYALALMIDFQIPIESIQKTIFPHPSVCEIIRDVLTSPTVWNGSHLK